MGKNAYIACIKTQNGKNYSYVDKLRAGENILNKIDGIDGLNVAHLCTSKAEADRLAAFWLECFRQNGTALF